MIPNANKIIAFLLAGMGFIGGALDATSYAGLVGTAAGSALVYVALSRAIGAVRAKFSTAKQSPE